MPDKDKIQPKSFRISENTANKFKEITQELEANQDQTLARLIAVYETEMGKESIPEARESIETFEGYVRTVTNMYLQAMQSIHDMKALVRSEYEADLKAKDRTIADLQYEVDEAKNAADSANEKEGKYIERIAALNEEKAEIRTRLDEKIQEAKEKYEALSSNYQELLIGYSKLQASDQEFKGLLATLTKERENIKKENERLQESTHSLESQAVQLSHRNDILTSELEHEKKHAEEIHVRLKEEMEQYKKQCDMENRLALKELEGELKDKYRGELDIIREELNRYKELYYQEKTLE